MSFFAKPVPTPARDPHALECFRKAGKIIAKARALGTEMIRPGTTIREVTEAVEAEVYRLGGIPAFPAQSSRNQIAAHYCAHPTDENRYEKGDLVKLDIGAAFDGYVCDTAVTVDLTGDARGAALCDAARAGLDAAIAAAGPGVSVSDIGAAIGRTIRSFGVNPVANLTGHGVGRWKVHTAPQIPNVADRGSSSQLAVGTVCAIEPFSTDGAGYVEERGRAEVFMASSKKVKITKGVDEAVLAAIEKWNGLPIARRYFREFPQIKVEETLLALLKQGCLVPYPPLCEAPGTLVAQFEHTLLITQDGVEILTL
ncbi:MAG: type II methionyl aminopeptidase [Planctomycetes bacterium]|nr:type II methionyl aminopeptidase [Planctomycetota bacterium]